jgi:hypothetical protein
MARRRGRRHGSDKRSANVNCGAHVLGGCSEAEAEAEVGGIGDDTLSTTG